MDLTKEELKYVCDAIPYQETVTYFRKYPKEFTKLRPGFRVKSLNEDMVARILYEFRTREFISSYLVRHIDNWIKQIEEELIRVKERGLNQEAAYIDVLSRSFFADNVALFFKIKEIEKSEEYLMVLSSAICFESEHKKEEEARELSNKQKLEILTTKRDEIEQRLLNGQKKADNLKKRVQDLKEQLGQVKRSFEEEKGEHQKTKNKCMLLEGKVEELEAKIVKERDDEIWMSSEMQQKIDALMQRVREQSESAEKLTEVITELEGKLASAEDDVKTWKNKVRNREKQIFTFKAERATLLAEKDNSKKQLKELKEALEQALSLERSYKEQLEEVRLIKTLEKSKTDVSGVLEVKELEASAKVVSKKYSENDCVMPMRPEDMDEFDEYYRNNLESIGFNQNDDGSIDFLYYLEKVLFQGVPLLIKRGPGINLANALSNTLYGVPVAARLLYFDGASVRDIDEFLTKTPDRVVCIDGFIGNCNSLELIPVLEQHRNKIIMLTYMFDKTLTFVPNEILASVYFICADMFESLLRKKDITEKPSEIKEVSFAYMDFKNPDTRLRKIFRDIAIECGVEMSAASTMADTIKDENHLNEILMFTLLPYVQKVFNMNPYNCSKRLQRYAGENGRCVKKDIIMEWFGY